MTVVMCQSCVFVTVIKKSLKWKWILHLRLYNDDDSYSSSLDETDSDNDGKNEFKNNKNYLANYLIC